MKLQFWRRRQRDAELDDEIQSHLEMAIRERIERGETAEQAKYSALREFGNRGLIKEVTRDTWGGRWLEHMAQDFRYAFRGARKNPGYTAIITLTLALGIGANSAIFSVVDATIYRPLPVPRADRVVVLLPQVPGGQGYDTYPISALDFLDWKQQAHSFEAMTATAGDDFNITGQGQPEHIYGLHVSPAFFRVFATPPAFGRGFADDEDQTGRDHVVVLSYAFWKQHLGGDFRVVGSTVSLNGEPYTVIGVMPESFHLPQFSGIELYVPLAFKAVDLAPAQRANRMLTPYARLRDGVGIEQANADMSAVAARLASEYPSDRGRGALVWTLQQQREHFNNKAAILFLLGCVGFVLLIACVNIANLLLARGSARQQELAVRAALGASRWRIARQLLSESLVLSAFGGTLGLLLGYWCLQLIRMALAFNVYAAEVAAEVVLDGRVLAYVALISFISAMLFGAAPALQLSFGEVNSPLKVANRTGSGDRGRRRLRSAFVVSELALALVLLVGVALMLKDLYGEYVMSGTGYDAHNVLTAGLALSGKRYEKAQSQAAFFESVLDRAAALPGVRFAALTNELPPRGWEGRQFIIDGQPDPGPDKRPRVRGWIVSPDYFGVLGIPLLRGRAFTVTDNEHSLPIVVIDEKMARRFFGATDPIGHRIAVYRGDASPPLSHVIVGIVGTVRRQQDGPTITPGMYECYLQHPVSSMSLAVRTSGDPRALASVLRRTVWSVDGEQPVMNVMTLREVQAQETGGDRLFGELLGSFALLALSLAAVGIYGVIAYTVAQRTREIGIRVALGAELGDIRRLVLRTAVRLIVLGLVIGALGVYPVSRLVNAVAQQPIAAGGVFISVALFIAAVALMASYVPAQRATKVDPIVALRYE